MQDQAPLGTEAGLAIPAEDGGVDLFVCTQWLHNDLDQVVGLPRAAARQGAHPAGRRRRRVRGPRRRQPADPRLPARAAHRPPGEDGLQPRRVLLRPRAPASGATCGTATRPATTARWSRSRPACWFDGGAYAVDVGARWSPTARASRPVPTVCPTRDVEGWAVRTNNPPCGAMRGFGAVQTCFGHEAQMDKLAAAARARPGRAASAQRAGARRPADHRPGASTGAAPVAEVIRTLRGDAAAGRRPVGRPAGPARRRRAHHRRRRRAPRDRLRGRVQEHRLQPRASTTTRPRACRLADGVATVTCACAEIGQGFVTLAQQITRDVLGVDDVVLAPADTSIGSAGSTSASRQTWISGGAVEAAAVAVRARLLAHVAARLGVAPGRAGAGRRAHPLGRGIDGSRRRGAWPRPPPAWSSRRPSSTTTRRPPPSTRTARATPTSRSPFAAHRAVVDVDPDLGLVRLVELATSQEVGRVLNPLQLLGQLEGGIAQGVGLAVMEEIVVDGRPDAEPLVHRLPHPHRARPARAPSWPRSSRSPSPAPRSGPRAWARRPRSRRARRSSPPSATPPASSCPRVPVRPSDIALAGSRPTDPRGAP